MTAPPTPTDPAESQLRVVVCGVAAAGKSTVGERLAEHLGCRHVDGDDLHPRANVEKMASGVALDEEDRRPWLLMTCEILAASDTIVVSCSALRRRHRDALRSVPGVRFVFLDVDERTARERSAARPGHFMRPAMVAGQFVILERPGPDETDAVTIDATQPLDRVVADAVDSLSPGRQSSSPLRRRGSRPG